MLDLRQLALCGALLAVLVSACGDDDSGGAASGPLRIAVSESAGAIDVQAGGSRVHVNRDPFQLTLTCAGGPDVAEDATGLYFVAAGQHVSLDRIAASHATATELQLTVDTSAGAAMVALSFPRQGVA